MLPIGPGGAWYTSPVRETLFEELKRYTRFGAEDEAALRRLAPLARPQFRAIAEAFYGRLSEHEYAHRVFSGPAQIERLKGTLVAWLDLLLSGPWDEAYYQRRLRIGRTHVRIELPQRYMFGAMDHIRIWLSRIANEVFQDDLAGRIAVVAALHKILDLELAIMLESYQEAFVEKVQYLERLEKVNLQRQLAMSEARYDEVVEKSEALIATADPEGGVILFNTKCESVTGIPRADAAGKSWLELFVAEADRPQVAAWHAAVLAGEAAPSYEGPVQGADGRAHQVRWHFTTLPGGDTPLLCAIGVDVSEEHELSIRTRRAERLASLGTMAAGLAHEIRNPLNAAHLQLNVARRRLLRTGGDEGAARAVELADSEMSRLAGLVEDFLQFARPQPLRLARGDLRATTEVTVRLVAPEAAARGVQISVAPGPAVWTEYDDEKMKQVLLNLLRNGVEAAAGEGGGGDVTVAVGTRGGDAIVMVEDSGAGFASDAPIFEPFFTTKESGTGLGLAIVHRIVGDHGGGVEAARTAGRTRFSIVLPLGGSRAEDGTVRA